MGLIVARLKVLVTVLFPKPWLGPGPALFTGGGEEPSLPAVGTETTGMVIVLWIFVVTVEVVVPSSAPSGGLR